MAKQLNKRYKEITTAQYEPGLQNRDKTSFARLILSYNLKTLLHIFYNLTYFR